MQHPRHPGAAPKARDLALTFAGGGNRALYQLGLLRRWRGLLSPRIGAVASCSAGACVATIWFSGRADPTYRFWQRRSRQIRRNVDLGALLRGRWSTPHPEFYRDLLMCAFAEGGFERIRSAPFPIYVLAALPPARLPLVAGVALGFCALAFDATVRGSRVHPRAARRLGFSPVVIDARSCETPEELAALVAASSAIPPFLQPGQRDGRALVDGGFIDTAPAFTAEGAPGIRRSLVMLSHPLREGLAPNGADEADEHEVGVARLYVAPSQTPAVGVLDCTRPDQLEQTIALGEADASLYEHQLRQLLAARHRPQPTRSWTAA